MQTEFENYKDKQKDWGNLDAHINVGNHHLETKCSLITKRVDPLIERLYETVGAHDPPDPTAIQKYCFDFNYEQDEEGCSSLMWDILESDIKRRFKEYNEQR